jgi:hypothetical protein
MAGPTLLSLVTGSAIAATLLDRDLRDIFIDGEQLLPMWRTSSTLTVTPDTSNQVPLAGALLSTTVSVSSGIAQRNPDTLASPPIVRSLNSDGVGESPLT